MFCTIRYDTQFSTMRVEAEMLWWMCELPSRPISQYSRFFFVLFLFGKKKKKKKILADRSLSLGRFVNLSSDFSAHFKT